MMNLLKGVQKFRHDVFPQYAELFETLSKGQHPHTLFITCSDSRIDPSLLTQSEPGELFVLRNAGNLVPKYGKTAGGEEAAIEFAVEALGVKNIVVCGHSQCGAMAALSGAANLEQLPSVAKWLTHSYVEQNVLTQIEQLKTHPAVSCAIDQRQLKLYGWIYHLEKANVEVYHKRQHEFVSIDMFNEQEPAALADCSLS